MISINTSVTTTPVKIVSKAINETRQVHVYHSGNDCFLGGSDVTTANGFKIQNNTTITVVVPPNEELWAVVQSGTHNVMTLTNYAEIQA
jgi:hypothetical protein